MSTLSFWLKIIAFGLLIFVWDYIIVNFRDLPAVIPIHFNAHGEADGFGSKMTLWLEAGIATAVFALVFYVSGNSKSPLLNLPQNSKDDKVAARLIMDIVNVFGMSIFAVVVYESVGVGLGKLAGLSGTIYFLLGALFVLIILILLYSRFFAKKPAENLP